MDCLECREPFSDLLDVEDLVRNRPFWKIKILIAGIIIVIMIVIDDVVVLVGILSLLDILELLVDSLEGVNHPL